MEPGASVSQSSAATRTQSEPLSEEQADRRYAQLQHLVGEQARAATSMADAATVADHVAILKRHRPRGYDIVASAGPDGSDLREHGFATANGFVGTEDVRVLCEDHDDLTDWPCAVVTALSERLSGGSSKAV